MNRYSRLFRSLLSVSLLTIFSISLFFGSTFAWFTDASGVVVNTFTLGELDARVYALNYDTERDKYVTNGSEYELRRNGMLAFNQALPTSELLFEPGVTFSLPVLRVRNFSAFPIHYKLRILRPAELPAGDYAPFYDVLRFYAKVGGTLVDLRSFEGEIAAADDTRGTPSELITIYIHMDEQAGNEFMNKQVSNLRIQFYLYQKEASGAAAAWYGDAADGYSTVETATSEDAYGTRRKIEGAQ